MYVIVASKDQYFDLPFLVFKALGHIPKYAGVENNVVSDFIELHSLYAETGLSITLYRIVNMEDEFVYSLLVKTNESWPEYERVKMQFDDMTAAFAEFLEANTHSKLTYENGNVMYTIQSDGSAFSNQFATEQRATIRSV